MANSSWTKSHIDSILVYKDTFLDTLHTLLAPFNPTNVFDLLAPAHIAPRVAQIAYPPCETDELVDYPLEWRDKIILSVAQFR